MNRTIRNAKLCSLTASALFFAFILATDAQAQSPARDLLVGTWRHVKMEQSADGKIVRTQESNGDSTTQFRADGTWSLESPQNNNSGTYRWFDENSIETTIVKSDHQNQVGWSSRKQIRVDAKFLLMIMRYDENAMKAFKRRADGTRPKEMIVNSTFARAVTK
jgi:hypothetical protein